MNMNLWLIPAFPLLGFLVNGVLGRRRSNAFVSAVAVGSVLLSFAWVVKTLMAFDAPYIERHATWFQSGDLRVGFDLSLDRLTAVMLLVKSGCWPNCGLQTAIAFQIHCRSIRRPTYFKKESAQSPASCKRQYHSG